MPENKLTTFHEKEYVANKLIVTTDNFESTELITKSNSGIKLRKKESSLFASSKNTPYRTYRYMLGFVKVQ